MCGMSDDPSSFMFPVIQATLWSKCYLVLEIFHLDLHILKCFKQLGMDYKTKRKLCLLQPVCTL